MNARPAYSMLRETLAGASAAAPRQPTARGDGSLTIVDEKILVDAPRGRDGRECLRLRAVRAKSADGKDIGWHDLRIFWRAEDGDWRPGQKGISIRGGELYAVVEALARAVGCDLITKQGNK